ncbi:MAG TPA: phosphate ABC transporter permease subunit PstC [Ilumatobacter sp.]|nr:phosphate ABC transporter permease subunit PstC [Ilumatobacter sp.]
MSTTITESDLTTAPKRRHADTGARWAFRAAAVSTLAITVLIILTLAVDAWDFLVKLGDDEHDGLTVLWDLGWFPRRGLFDIATLVLGTLIVTGIAMIVAAPLGLGVAVYLAEYAPARFRKIVKPVIEVLAGVPSVVLGYFAIAFINPEIITRVFSGANQAFTLAAAGIAVGILTIPIIASVAEDALRAVPMSLREASYGLGAERLQSTFRVVLPAAISGIVAALILGISRAIGETMVVAIAAGAVGGGLRSYDPLQPGQTMTAAMAALGFGSDQVAGDNLAFQSLYFVGLLLFVITLLLNVASGWLVNRVREVY